MNDRFWPLVIEQPAETQQVEYKKDEPLDANLKGIVRCALGMSNTENGGVLIVGVDDNGGVITVTGMSDANLASYNVQTLGMVCPPDLKTRKE